MNSTTIWNKWDILKNEYNINHIAAIVEGTSHGKDMSVIKYVLKRKINIYEILLIVQNDTENFMSCVKLRTMLSSVIKSTDLFKEFRSLKVKQKTEFLIDLILGHIPLSEKMITIDCFILNNGIIYLHHIPNVLRPYLFISKVSSKIS